MLALCPGTVTKKRAERVLPTPRSALTKPTAGVSNMASSRICSIEGCNKTIVGANPPLCPSHYYRNKRYGHPLAGRTPDGEPLAFLKAQVETDRTDCIPWPYAKGDGYGQVRFEGRMWRPNRLMCQWAHGIPPTDTHEAAHLCGNGKQLGCVNPSHIRWKTPQENTDDKVLHGTIPIGENAPSAKLTRDQIYQIRALEGVISQEQIGRRFGISQCHVSSVIRRECWAWLSED